MMQLDILISQRGLFSKHGIIKRETSLNVVLVDQNTALFGYGYTSDML